MTMRTISGSTRAGWTRSALLAAGLAVALALGLQGATAQGAPQGGAEATKLRVGYIPVGVYAYLWRARDAGYFRDERLEVELVPMAGGGEIIPALQSGSLQFGISDALGVLNARNGGIPATYVSFNFSQSSDDPVHAVVTADEGVTSPKDLAGKAVATNLSFNTDWTMMRAWLAKNGVDVKTVKFREVPFPDMLAALRGRTIAAAGVTEPFLTLAQSQNLRVLGYYFTDVQSPVVLSGVVALAPYIARNADVVTRFVAAVDKAIRDFDADPAVARRTIAANTKIPPAVVEKMHLGKWEVSAAPAQIQFWIDAARREGIVTDATDLKGLIWQPSR